MKEVEFNKNSDLEEESLEDVILGGGEPSCTDFIVNGVCTRWNTEDCPFRIVSRGYELCEIPKSEY